MSTILNTPGIQIISLSQWVQVELTSLLTPAEPAQFQHSFDELFSPDVDVTFNGEHITREEYAKRLMKLSPVSFTGKPFVLQDLQFNGTVQTKATGVPGHPVSLLSALHYGSWDANLS